MPWASNIILQYLQPPKHMKSNLSWMLKTKGVRFFSGNVPFSSVTNYLLLSRYGTVCPGLLMHRV